MVTVTLDCPHCGSEDLKRNGHAPNGKHKARIKARADHPRTRDDRYVSEYIFDVYYQRDHRQYMTEIALQLKQRFGVPIEHIQVIRNGLEISVEQFNQAVELFANDLLKIKV